jgi:hypothetical protein
VSATVDRNADRGTTEVPGARVALVVLGAAWIVVLVLYLRHAIVLSSDSVNNHVHVWYIARDIWHHARLPWRMPVLAHGDAFAYPYGFVNWTTAALAWPLFGNWTVTLWTALGVIGCIVATFVAFPELRSGWWAAAVLANPAIIDALLFGQQSFAWGSMLLLFGVAAWRRGHHGWAAVLIGVGQANHAAIVLPIGVLLVAFALVISSDRREILRWYALSLAITIPAALLVFASPTTTATSAGAEVVDFFDTLGPRVLIVALPIFCVVLQRTRIPALAPVGLLVALIAGLSFEVPLNVGQQWHALGRNNADTVSLDGFLHSPAFVPGLTYRVLRAGDGKVGLYHVLRAGGRLDSELFPESMGMHSFRDADAYATFLCARHVDRIVHDDTYDESRHTNEIELIDALEQERVGGVLLHRVAGGSSWQVDAVDRSGCATTS